MYTTIKGKTTVGYYGAYNPTIDNTRLYSYRIANSGTTSAKVSLVVSNGTEIYEITPMQLSVDPGDVAIEKDIHITIPAKWNLNIWSDTVGVTYWIIIES